MSNLLLNFYEQQDIKPVATNWESKYQKLAEEVESLELNKLLGYAFYQAISKSPNDYSSILNETEFTDGDDNVVKHKGLKYVIAYLNFSKYVGESYVHNTFTGMVQKIRQDSERISSGDLKRLQQEYREIAMNAFELIRQYLDLNYEDYPLWNHKSDKLTFKPKFYGVKNTRL